MALPAAESVWKSTRSFDLNRESAWGAAMSASDNLVRVPPRIGEHTAPRAFACLIEVPAARRALSGRARSRGKSRRDSGRPSQTRTKRRLRREVRVSGYALLALAPLFAACALSRPDRPARVVACSIAEATAGDRASESRGNPQLGDEPAPGAAMAQLGDVILSSGSAPPPSGNDSDVPIVFPGYVLPDDSHEESTHEGS